MYNFYSSILVIINIFVEQNLCEIVGGGGGGRGSIYLNPSVTIFTASRYFHNNHVQKPYCLGLKDKLGYERKECVTRFILKYFFGLIYIG